MFVGINNKYKSAIEVEGVIQKARNDGAITPKFAMEILSLTNHRSNIKKLVKAIKDNCKTEAEILPYKEFILSCVDEREMSEEALDNLQDMAILCGCEDEFKEANGKPKFYDKFDYKGAVVKSKQEFGALERENLKLYFDADKVDLHDCDLSNIKDIKFREDAEVNLRGAKNLPKNLDLSQCSKVNLEECDLNGLNLKFREGAEVDLGGAKNLPKDLDVSMCSEVNLHTCYLRGLNLKFREGAIVYLSCTKSLPEDLDISMCSGVCLSYCDLRGLNLKFREGAKVDLDSAKNLPEDLDLSMCSVARLSYCDLSGLNLRFRDGSKVILHGAKNLPRYLDLSQCSNVGLYGFNLRGVNFKFKEGAEVNLGRAENLPRYLDLSQCSKVDLNGCDLRGVNIKFREGAIVKFNTFSDPECSMDLTYSDRCKLPEVLDLSMCSDVNLRGCVWDYVEMIKFKDKEQEDKFMGGVGLFKGKVVYAPVKKKKEKEVCSDVKKPSLAQRLKIFFDIGM